MSNQDKPLVTFAVFAYNQEQFIREAIAGAFSQTYEPLEIILSDDCSSDRTFEIMQEMAASYCGNHKVKVRRTSSNRGVFNHLLEVVREAQGSLLVLAAGDDISYPDRTEILYTAWKKTSKKVLCSYSDLINEDSKLLDVCKWRGKGQIFREMFEHSWPVDAIHGATSAYDKSIFDKLTYSEYPIYSEDSILTFISLLMNLDIHIEEKSLVAYRVNDNSIYNNRLNLALSKVRYSYFSPTELFTRTRKMIMNREKAISIQLSQYEYMIQILEHLEININNNYRAKITAFLLNIINQLKNDRSIILEQQELKSKSLIAKIFFIIKAIFTSKIKPYMITVISLDLYCLLFVIRFYAFGILNIFRSPQTFIRVKR